MPEIASDTFFFHRPSICLGHGARSELIKLVATSVGTMLAERPEMVQRLVVGAVQKALPAGRLVDELITVKRCGI